MNKQINFVVPEPPERLSSYQKVIISIVDPIRIHLKDSTISSNALPDAVNIHFFNEPRYRKEKKNDFNGIHVFMSHGMGDKQWRDGPQVKSFDYIFVSGPRWVEKMIGQNIPAEKVLMTGYAKLDPLFQGKIKKTGYDKKTVLYAPTHVGSVSCTSYPAFKEYYNQFPSDLQLLFCPHPYHRKKNTPVLQELADADVVISDGSSVIYEALALGLPVVFPDWIVKDGVLKKWPISFTAQIYQDGIGYHAKTFKQMINQIYKAIDRGIRNKDKGFIDGIFPPDLRGNSGKATALALKKIAR